MLVVWTPVAYGEIVTCEAAGKTLEGEFVTLTQNAPLVLLIHGWDGLTEYETRRAGMLAEPGNAVFRSDRYSEDADRKSWDCFTCYLDQVLK